jgi:hypothetical protein
MGGLKSSNAKKKTVTTSKDHPTTSESYTQYSVVVGFEVNYPDTAFKNDVHYLGEDYGHAFFYLVKNQQVTKFFSFGPMDNPDGKAYVPRLGTADFQIPEETKLFRVDLSEDSYNALMKDTALMRAKIKSGNEKYTAMTNDTCAETARDILDAHIPNLPKGSGKVETNFVVSTGPFDAVNPYMWHKNFKKSIYTELTYSATDKWKKIMKALNEGSYPEDPLAGY